MTSIRFAVLKKNYLQVLLVFTAFALMVLAGYFFVRTILQNRLLMNAENALFSAEANIRAAFAEADVTMNGSLSRVLEMIEDGESQDKLLQYLRQTTAWMRRSEGGLLGFYGIYGFIRGELIDGVDVHPGEDYIPQSRPWYQAAVRTHGGSLAYTAPYMDWESGDVIVSVVRNIISGSGEIYGILSIDVNMNWLNNYVRSLSLAEGGYGMIVSQNMVIMSYGDESKLGLQIQKLGGDYMEISQTLRQGEDITAKEISDINGEAAIVYFQKIFNNWYVGIVTPSRSYYWDIYAAAFLLSSLGFVFALILSYILLRLSAAKMKADEDSRSKSSFLANMSHEIRTPMNAIVGMSELMLRCELPKESRSYAMDIKQAGANLLSIINDLLDFSKIEAGRLEIIPVNYRLSSLVNNAVSIIRMRLIEKPIRFYTNIDSQLPNELSGDEVRLRQILLNLLSNAVKYTEKGFISVTITQAGRVDSKAYANNGPGRVLLKITVADSGVGIKADDRAKLFGEFVQVDVTKNRGIEGTGLGLAIAKRLCRAMGGDITVESEYGKGSAFTVIIPQEAVSDVPFAQVDKPEEKKVLLYTQREVYAKSMCWSLENLGVPHTLVTGEEAFEAALKREDWYYVFSGYGLYNKIKPVIEKLEAEFPGKKKLSLALVVEWGMEVFIPGVRLVSLPIQALSIADVLNGRADSKGYYESAAGFAGTQFSVPGARLLVVDDITTNLKVAEGLLSPYKAEVDTCLSGMEAIELVKRREYDIVFMDHMMPEMDGIEATAKIRDWERLQQENGGGRKPVPIIALTANAVSGMKEMFLEKGFNDFLAKPIDLSKLDDILEKWIHAEKKLQEENKEEGFLDAFAVDGLDLQAGKNRYRQKPYLDILRVYYSHTPTLLEKLRRLMEKPLSEESLADYIITVHSLKGSSYGICAQTAAKQAEVLEKAARNGAAEPAETACLIGTVEKLLQNIGALLEKAAAIEPAKPRAASPDKALLAEFLEACNRYQAGLMEETLAKLEGYEYEAGGELVTWLRKQADDLEFDAIQERLGKELL
ncbi:hybrid sensor histidine kinase/response regulator [Breznakiellaceae bacterium SP9]